MAHLRQKMKFTWASDWNEKSVLIVRIADPTRCVSSPGASLSFLKTTCEPHIGEIDIYYRTGSGVMQRASGKSREYGMRVFCPVERVK
jgi:hypothetical protein